MDFTDTRAHTHTHMTAAALGLGDIVEMFMSFASLRECGLGQGAHARSSASNFIESKILIKIDIESVLAKWARLKGKRECERCAISCGSR